MVQTSPLAASAAVGGHGYNAASAAGLFPAESVAGQVAAAGAGPHGGPTVPWTIVNVPEMVPVALTVTSFCSDGALQLTGTVELTIPPSFTCGWLASLLHSRTFPIELSVNPLPVTVTTVPLLTVLGVIVTVPVSGAAALAETALAKITSPEINRAADPMTPSVVPMPRSLR